MPEYASRHLAKKFYDLFAGNRTVYGRSELTGEVNQEGKHEAKSWLEHKETTEDVWLKHIEGTMAIGQVPITDSGMIRWAAFDIDVYSEKLGTKQILESITQHGFPIILCRSKSGGAHGYVFFSEPVKAENVRTKLQELAAFFGQGGCEIFPKQDRLGQSSTGDVMYGNWLNMPYDGPNSLRYALNIQEQALTASEFCDLAEQSQISEQLFLGLRIPREEVVDMEDGPPCLNHIWAKKTDMTGGRNTLLFNTAVYLKTKNPDITTGELSEALSQWNSKLDTPLDEKELKATVINSTKRREYRYQCGNPILKRHCNSHICCQCLYGIDGDENAFDPNNKSLIQLRTEPPLFFIDYKKTQLVLTKEEFWRYDSVRQACMVQSLHIPPKMDQEHWLNLVNGYLQSCTIIDVPPEATPVGQLIEHIQNWKKRAGLEPSVLCNGQPHLTRANKLIFRLKDLKEMLRQQQFKSLPENKLIEALRNNLQGANKSRNVDSKHIRVWEISGALLEDADTIKINQPQEQEDNF